MEKIELTIDGVTEQYTICTAIDDLLFGQYSEMLKVLWRREQVVDIETTDGEKLMKTLPTNEESQEFKDLKDLDLIAVLSDVPQSYYEEYPELKQDVFEAIDDIYHDDSSPIEAVIINGENYIVTDILQWTFQEWCDMEGMLQQINDIGVLPILAVAFKRAGKYDRFHNDYHDKVQQLSMMSAQGLVSCINKIMEDMQPMRDSHPFIYKMNVSDEPTSKFMQEHLERMKWEDTIVTLAQSNVFNSVQGTLFGVRNANVLDVLNYLNVTKSKEGAEYLEYKQKSKQTDNFDI